MGAEAEEDVTRLTGMSQAEGPETQVGRGVGNAAQAELYGVNGLVQELISKIKLEEKTMLQFPHIKPAVSNLRLYHGPVGRYQPLLRTSNQIKPLSDLFSVSSIRV